MKKEIEGTENQREWQRKTHTQTTNNFALARNSLEILMFFFWMYVYVLFIASPPFIWVGPKVVSSFTSLSVCMHVCVSVSTLAYRYIISFVFFIIIVYLYF